MDERFEEPATLYHNINGFMLSAKLHFTKDLITNTKTIKTTKNWFVITAPSNDGWITPSNDGWITSPGLESIPSHHLETAASL
jgi:hypothetical protein